MINESLHLAPPWKTYYLKIKALFGSDPEVKISYNEDNLNPKVTIHVEERDKADGIQYLLGTEKKFGNVTLTITVIPPNSNDLELKTEKLISAFTGNPIVNRIVVQEDFLGGGMVYCEFEKEVIQFPNDDFSDLNGNYTGLAEDLARSILVKGGHPQIHYCTAAE